MSFDIDDRVLAHIRLVVMNKLRRNEPFMMHLDRIDGLGPKSLWIHPAVPLVFHFFGSRSPVINRAWVEALMAEASGAHGMTMLPEPDPSASAAPATA
ncbi:MAG: ATP-dependent DNA ligase [Microbacterium sp.]|uniref:DUF7882 family protein n=1 Tax=Microbacterium sp. TaxID=51671 RepID=UPI0039E4E03C